MYDEKSFDRTTRGKKGTRYRRVHDFSGGKSSASPSPLPATGCKNIEKSVSASCRSCKSRGKPCKTRFDSVHVCTCSHTRVRTRAYGEIEHDRRHTRVACPACNYRPWLNNAWPCNLAHGSHKGTKVPPHTLRKMNAARGIRFVNINRFKLWPPYYTGGD